MHGCAISFLRTIDSIISSHNFFEKNSSKAKLDGIGKSDHLNRAEGAHFEQNNRSISLILEITNRVFLFGNTLSKEQTR